MKGGRLLRAGDPVLASLGHKSLEEGSVLARLGVPLDSDREAPRRIFDSLERSVHRPRGLHEAISEPTKRLVVM